MNDRPAGDPRIGTLLAGTYRLDAEIGRGAMGVVYRAHSEMLSQDFAVKVLSPELAEDEHVRHRFLQEAKALTALSHQHVVPVRHCGEEGGHLFVVMGLCAGETLAALIEREAPLPETRAAALASQVLEALAAAHAAGIVHRDLKPENVMVEQRTGEDGAPRDHVSVLDFGLARVVGTAASKMPGALATVDGDVVGTVAYMSPEQVRAASDVDGRSDLFSLGVVLYEMLAGRRPFESDAILSVMMRILEAPTPHLPKSGPDGASQAMRSIVTRALMKDREDRFQSAGDFLAALRGELDPWDAATAQPAGTFPSRPGRWRTPLLIGAGLVGVALLVVLGTGGLGLGGPDRRALANQALSECAHAESIQHLEALLDEEGAKGEDLLELARVRIAIEDPTARGHLSEAERLLGSRDARVQTGWGRFFWRVEDDHAKALDALGAAIVADATAIEALELRLEMLFDEASAAYFQAAGIDRLTRVEADVRTLARRRPTSAMVPLMQGRMYAIQALRTANMGERVALLDDAINALETSAEADDRYVVPLLHQSGAYLERAAAAQAEGQYDAMRSYERAALAALDRAAERFEAWSTHRCQFEQRATLYHLRSLSRLRVGDTDGAIEDIRRVYAERKDLTDYITVADGLRTAGQLDEAIDLYQRLIDATGSVDAYFNIGSCHERKAASYLQLGERAEAAKSYERAIGAYGFALGDSVMHAVSLAYRGEAYVQLSYLQSDPLVSLAAAGRDFRAAQEAWPKGHAQLELDYRYAEYLCRTGKAGEARRRLESDMGEDASLNPSIYGRYAYVLLCDAASTWAEPATAAATLQGAWDTVERLRKIQRRHTLGVELVTADVALMRALRGAGTGAAHRQRAAEALLRARTQAQGMSAYVRHRVAAAEAEIRLHMKAGDAVHAGVKAARIALYAAGRLRPDAAFYEQLAAALEEAGLEADAAIAQAAADERR